MLHTKNPYFVPPFPGAITKIFSKNSPYQRHGELYPFIAYRDWQPVGRIAATIYRPHNDYYNDKTAFFGFFDCINDSTVAAALLAKAEETVKSKGMKVLRGPFNPTINDECGLLVEGFEASPFIMMPFNPYYYVNLYESIGLCKARDLFAFYIPAVAETPERIEKIVERVRKNSKVTVRNIRMDKLYDELKIIHKLYNETLDRNWSFVPISLEDLEFAANDLKEITDPDLVFIAEYQGSPIGFSMALPNVNEFLLRARSSKGLLRFLRLAWYFKTKRPKEARLAILGISPEFRNKGIAALFYYESLVRGKRKYIGGELSWVEETNEEITKAITLMGGQKYKTYRIYEKTIEGKVASSL